MTVFLIVGGIAMLYGGLSESDWYWISNGVFLLWGACLCWKHGDEVAFTKRRPPSDV